MEDTMTLGVEALAWMDNLVCEITRCPICIPNTKKKVFLSLQKFVYSKKKKI